MPDTTTAADFASRSDYGTCPECGGEFQITKKGVMRHHAGAPGTAPGRHYGKNRTYRCPGVGQPPADTTAVTCTPITIWRGPEECFERECEEYATEGGDDRPEVERCSHLKDETVCAAHSTAVPDGCGHDRFESVTPWPCPHAAGSGAAQ